MHGCAHCDPHLPGEKPPEWAVFLIGCGALLSLAQLPFSHPSRSRKPAERSLHEQSGILGRRLEIVVKDQ